MSKITISSTTETRYHCGKCETGIVKVVIKNNKNGIDMSCKPCDNKKCREWYGLFGIGELKEV